MVSLKHVGRILNTNRRCVVVFREIYNEEGVAIDEDNCLVFETETLPDAENQELMRIVESDAAQTTGDLFNVLARAKLGNGLAALNWLASSNRLRKFPTDNVELTPDARTAMALNVLNKIVKMQKSGASEEEVNNVLRDDTDMPPRSADQLAATIAETAPDAVSEAETQTGDLVLDDKALAKNLVDQAKLLESQAKELRSQAKVLAPSKTRTTTKKPANNKA